MYSSRHTPAGGWAAATLLAVLPASSGSVAATPAGSFVVVYASSAITSPPGQGFGAPVTVASGSTAVMVAAAPGHALTVWRGGGATNATVATEPLT